MKIKTIGENPGHKQSGQYVWPAAKALAESIVEMGSGCGIGGIVAAKVLPSCSSLILTDYDPGALALIDDNIVVNEVGAVCRTSFLEWGNLEAAETKAIAGSVDAVIGADLIYSKDVVFPLLSSVKAAFASPEAVFLLVTSFSLGEVRWLSISTCFSSVRRPYRVSLPPLRASNRSSPTVVENSGFIAGVCRRDRGRCIMDVE